MPGPRVPRGGVWGVRPACSGGPTISPTLLPADVRHRDHDRQAGELRGHEGGLGQLPAAPPPPPLQLPVPAPHALGPHPQEGQGALHLQVRQAWGLAGGLGRAVTGVTLGLPGRTTTATTQRGGSHQSVHGWQSFMAHMCGGGPTSPVPAGCVPVSTRTRSLSLAS